MPVTVVVVVSGNMMNAEAASQTLGVGIEVLPAAEQEDPSTTS